MTMDQDLYRQHHYRPSDFSEENLPRRQRHFAPRKKPKLHFSSKKLWSPMGLALLLLGLFVLIRWILGPLSSFFWQIPGFTGFPFQNKSYAVMIFDEKESFGSSGEMLFLGEMNFGKGFYKETLPLEKVPALSLKDLDPIRQSLFKTQDYPLNFFHFDLHLQENYQELQKFYPEKDWDGLIFVSSSLAEDFASLDKHMTWKFYNPFSWPFQSRKLARAFDAQELFLFTEKESSQKKLDQKEWSGYRQFEHDYFWASLYRFQGQIPSEMIHKDLRYEVSFSDERDTLGFLKAQAVLSLTLENPSKTHDFLGYFRYLTPKESRFISKAKLKENYPHAHAFGEPISLKAGERKHYRYEYQLPSSIWKDESYHWAYKAQKSWSKEDLSFYIHAPYALELQAPDFSVYDRLGFDVVDLSQSQERQLSFLEDSKAPVWLKTQILSPQKILLEFSETLGANAEDPSRYRVSGTTVLGVEKDDNTIILELEGLGEQERETTIILKGLRDLNNNPMIPMEPEASFLWSQEWIDLFSKDRQDTLETPEAFPGDPVSTPISSPDSSPNSL